MPSVVESSTGTSNPLAHQTFLTNLIAALVSAGWTTVNNAGAAGSRDVLMESKELTSGVGNKFILRLQESSGNLYATTARDRQGTTLIGETAAFSVTPPVQANDFSYVLRINDVSVGGFCRTSTPGTFYFGFLRRSLPSTRDGITKTTSSRAIGDTTLPVAANMTGRLQVGQRIQIWNFAQNNSSANKTNGETVTITSVGSSSIGCSALTKAYDSGALVGAHPMPALVGGNTGSQFPAGTSYHPGQPDGFWGGAGVSLTWEREKLGHSFSSVADPTDNSYAPTVFLLYGTDTTHGGAIGYAYHFLGSEGSGPVPDDTLDDGSHTFIVCHNSSGSCVAIQRT